MRTRTRDSRNNRFRPNYDTFDLFIDGKKITRLYGIKTAMAQAKKSGGGLWGRKLVELIDIKTGEIVYSTLL